VTLGSAWFNVRDGFDHYNTFDLTWVHPLTRRLLYQVESLDEFEYNVPNLITPNRKHQFNNFGGAAQYLIYTFTPRVSGTMRVERFDVPEGLSSRVNPESANASLPGLYTDVTAGLAFKVRQQPSGNGAFIIRPEVRLDYCGESREFEGPQGLLTPQHYLWTAAVDFILRW
jgi:hypothetical protein